MPQASKIFMIVSFTKHQSELNFIATLILITHINLHHYNFFKKWVRKYFIINFKMNKYLLPSSTSVFIFYNNGNLYFASRENDLSRQWQVIFDASNSITLRPHDKLIVVKPRGIYSCYYISIPHLRPHLIITSFNWQNDMAVQQNIHSCKTQAVQTAL